MTTVICPKCGAENPDSAMNCTQCRINLQFALEQEHPDKFEKAEKKEPYVERKGAGGFRLYAERFGLGAISCSTVMFIGWSLFQAVVGYGWYPDVEMVLISLAIGVPLGGISGLLFGRKDKKAAIIAGFVVVIVPILLLFLFWPLLGQ